MPDSDIELLRRAYVFSALAHKGQVRQSGQPYLVHPLEVAYFLADLRLDPAAIIAGLLHDVVEDTLTTVEKIEELFGKEVAHLVEGVTKIGAIPFSSSAERQAESFRKMLLAMVDDIRVVLVKLADRLQQHADAPGDARGPPRAHGAGDPRHLRADREPPRHEPAEERARGPGVPVPRARGLRGAAGPGRAPAQGDRGPDRGAGQGARGDAQGGPDPGRRDRRPDQAPLQHPPEAAAPEDRPRAGLRLRRLPDHHQEREGLLRGARHHPPRVAAGAGPHQGLHRHAAAQRLPVAPHVGHHRARAWRSRCRSAPRRCTGRPRKASRRTGSTRKAASAPPTTSGTSSGCGRCSSGSRRSATRRSSSRT